MTRKAAKDFDPQVLQLFDKYVHGDLSRRGFLQAAGKAHGYLVRPAAAKGSLVAVLVVHENRGLNPHIEDIARRLALAGHVAFAPDALYPLGGYPGDEDQARALCVPGRGTRLQQRYDAAL
jgi:carboxymethylenebutenolidase